MRRTFRLFSARYFDSAKTDITRAGLKETARIISNPNLTDDQLNQLKAMKMWECTTALIHAEKAYEERLNHTWKHVGRNAGVHEAAFGRPDPSHFFKDLEAVFNREKEKRANQADYMVNSFVGF
jgi:hypothetical protein